MSLESVLAHPRWLLSSINLIFSKNKLFLSICYFFGHGIIKALVNRSKFYDINHPFKVQVTSSLSLATPLLAMTGQFLQFGAKPGRMREDTLLRLAARPRGWSTSGSEYYLIPAWARLRIWLRTGSKTKGSLRQSPRGHGVGRWLGVQIRTLGSFSFLFHILTSFWKPVSTQGHPCHHREILSLNTPHILGSRAAGRSISHSLGRFRNWNCICQLLHNPCASCADSLDRIGTTGWK